MGFDTECSTGASVHTRSYVMLFVLWLVLTGYDLI